MSRGVIKKGKEGGEKEEEGRPRGRRREHERKIEENKAQTFAHVQT